MRMSYDTFEFLWRNNGHYLVDKDGAKTEYMPMRDALAVPDAPIWMPKVVTNIIREAVEPLLIGTNLLQRINYSYGQTITFGSVGALVAADIAEGQEYPEARLNFGGGTVTCTIGKSGLALRINEEVIRYSQYDVVGMHLRAAGRALARHKEQKIFNMIRSLGVVTHDNINPTQSIFGPTSGRGIDGQFNGSLLLDDLFDCFAQVITQGFQPDTILMHPLTWVMFVKDSHLRSLALASGNNTWFGTWQGNPVGRAPWDAVNGGLGPSAGQAVDPNTSPISAYSQTITSAPNFPNLGFPFPFRVLVSPFVWIDPVRKLTDIMVFDSKELGVIVVDEEITTEEINDPLVDILKIKVRERYGLAILNDGLGIGVMKNVSLKPNAITPVVQPKIDVAGSLTPLDPTQPVITP